MSQILYTFSTSIMDLQTAGLLVAPWLDTTTVNGEKDGLSVVKHTILLPESSDTTVSGVSQETRTTREKCCC